MVPRLEALNATVHAMPADQIFAFISLRAAWRGQSLALDRQKILVLSVFDALDPYDRVARRRHQVDIPAAIAVVGLFPLELEEIPTLAVTRQAVQMTA